MGTRGRFQKWIICDPFSAVCDVAYIALAVRLRPIPELLTKAATEFEEGIEHVHRVRVATRRAVAALEVFGPFASRNRVKRVKRHLRKIRRAAGRARDLDVLIVRSERRGTSVDDIRPLRQRRKKAQKHITKVHRKLVQSQHLQGQVKRLLRSITDKSNASDPRTEMSFTEWAHGILRTYSEEFIAAWPRDMTDLEALHEFRIKGKRLRYVIELLVCAFPDPLRTSVYPQIESLQAGLGIVNDHLVACQKLDAWIRSAKGQDAQRLEVETHEERSALETAIGTFEHSWSPAVRQRLESQLWQIIDSSNDDEWDDDESSVNH